VAEKLVGDLVGYRLVTECTETEPLAVAGWSQVIPLEQWKKQLNGRLNHVIVVP